MNAPGMRRVGRLVDELIELSPKSPATSWWNLAMLLGLLVCLTFLVAFVGTLGLVLFFLIAVTLTVLWCVKGWRGWLLTAGTMLDFFIAFLPFGQIVRYILMAVVTALVVGFMYKLHMTRKYEAAIITAWHNQE